jgi:hypothetical protein
MAESLYLLLDRRHDPRVAVARIADRNAGSEIDVAIPFDVPEFGVQPAFDVDGCDVALAACDRGELARSCQVLRRSGCQDR